MQVGHVVTKLESSGHIQCLFQLKATHGIDWPDPLTVTFIRGTSSSMCIYTALLQSASVGVFFARPAIDSL